MSLDGSSARNSHLSQGDEQQWCACPCPQSDLYIHKAKYGNQEKYHPSIKERSQDLFTEF